MFILSVAANVVLAVWLLLLKFYAMSLADNARNKIDGLEKELKSLTERNRYLEGKEQEREKLEEQVLKLEFENHDLQSQRQFVLDAVDGLPIAEKYISTIKARLHSMRD